MTDKELAVACKEAGQCRFCKEPVRQECLKNECWKATYYADRMPPCVYYGLVAKAEDKEPEETEGWRKRWFEKSNLPYEPPRQPVNLFA